jgi:hypothetical protein
MSLIWLNNCHNNQAHFAFFFISNARRYFFFPEKTSSGFGTETLSSSNSEASGKLISPLSSALITGLG